MRFMQTVQSELTNRREADQQEEKKSRTYHTFENAKINQDNDENVTERETGEESAECTHKF